ncbi:DUF1836 domain-containing protein [Anaerorhabdus furcosa]|uniref:Cell division protein ZapA n=1 Tax=Anaerorhabdus furcosa TaxID=118967 RepID=A0A1T4JUA3_9FIRM|nr:DUF1836 domain-containing protein [Anaerorhabdus furcosa]SJZ33704.1 Cell division protein ZapA [Anaerorhabdus furcosa]
MDKELEIWSEQVNNVHLPRWEELPDMDLYKDQVITLIEKYVGTLIEDEKILTPSMINNYVKWKMIPAPNRKKQYNRVHFGYLIAITILKQVMTIKEVKDGILFQANLSGTHEAYNFFCEEQEKALKQAMAMINAKIKNDTRVTVIQEDEIALKMAALAFANKIVASKKVKLQQESFRGEL